MNHPPAPQDDDRNNDGHATRPAIVLAFTRPKGGLAQQSPLALVTGGPGHGKSASPNQRRNPQ